MNVKVQVHCSLTFQSISTNWLDIKQVLPRPSFNHAHKQLRDFKNVLTFSSSHVPHSPMNSNEPQSKEKYFVFDA